MKQFISHEFQVIQTHRERKCEGRFVFKERLAEMTPKSRMQKSAIGELHSRCFIGVIDRCNYVPSAGEVFKQKCVVGEGASVAVRKDNNRVSTFCDLSILAAVSRDSRK